MVRQAIADARTGDPDAADWLIHDAADWLVYVVPSHCDVADIRAIHARIMRHAGVERLTAHAY